MRRPAHRPSAPPPPPPPGVRRRQRKEAHKFYFREGMHVVSFNFRKDMSR
ncbi:MAG: hypothetical protein IPO58_13325 [Betaproteobacteria bacterium]|nr:hypothetical protein [Betaproteobacteria bacterium]